MNLKSNLEKRLIDSQSNISMEKKFISKLKTQTDIFPPEYLKEIKIMEYMANNTENHKRIIKFR